MNATSPHRRAAAGGPPRRVLTALALIPPAIALVALGPTALVSAVFALVVLLAAWEWAGLAGVRGRSARAAFVAATAALLGAVHASASSALDAGILLLAVAWWLFALGWIAAAERGPPRAWGPAPGAGGGPDGGRAGAPLARLACGWLVLVPAWQALAMLHAREPAGPQLVLALFLIVWSADTGAYLAGRRWGRHRLAPRVSPGKTWEGVAGGCAAAGAVAAGCGLLAGEGRWPVWLLAALGTVAFSIVGDLLESLFKRRAGCKDSGRILPGHGGVLDRIDSMSAGAPLFALVVRAAGY